MRGALLLTSVVLCAVGCGDDGVGGGGLDAPACEPGELRVTGTLDGAVIDELAVASNFGFVNALGESNGYLEIRNAAGTLILRLEFPELLANGEIGNAAGFVDLSATGGPAAGNCLPGVAFPGEMMLARESSRIGAAVLRDLHQSPFCEGPAVAGDLGLCWNVPDER